VAAAAVAVAAMVAVADVAAAAVATVVAADVAVVVVATAVAVAAADDATTTEHLVGVRHWGQIPQVSDPFVVEA